MIVNGKSTSILKENNTILHGKKPHKGHTGNIKKNKRKNNHRSNRKRKSRKCLLLEMMINCYMMIRRWAQVNGLQETVITVKQHLKNGFVLNSILMNTEKINILELNGIFKIMKQHGNLKTNNLLIVNQILTFSKKGFSMKSQIRKLYLLTMNSNKESENGLKWKSL